MVYCGVGFIKAMGFAEEIVMKRPLAPEERRDISYCPSFNSIPRLHGSPAPSMSASWCAYAEDRRQKMEPHKVHV